MGGVVSYLQRPYKVRSPRGRQLDFSFVTRRWQYVQRDPHFVDQSDFDRMRTIYRPGRRVRVPAWAMNQAVIRHVLCARAWTLLHSYSKPMPPTLNYKFLDSQVSEVVAIRAKANPCASNLRMLAAVRRCGTYLQLNSIILWRAWRLGEDCVTIADDLGLTTSAVHGMLNRLRDTAARLGLDGTPARRYRVHKFTPEECARGARRKSAKRSAATSAANRRRWKDPAYRAHMAAKLSAAMRGTRNAQAKTETKHCTDSGNGGIIRRMADTPSFGTLKEAVTEAAASKYTVVYDNRYKSPVNPTGAVRLSEWPGLTGKKGGGYQYAFDGMKIIARPVLPSNHGLNMHPKDSKETLDVLRQAAEKLKDVGPAVEFLLAGDERP